MRSPGLGGAVAALVVLLAAPPVSAQVFTRENANGVVEATNIPGIPGYRLTYPGKGTLIHSQRFTGSYSGEFDPDIEDAAALHQVSPALVKAVIKTESAFDQWAVSSKGAQGLMQLMPPTARRFGVSDPFNPRQNIFAGTRYLRILLDLFQGDVDLALAGYNAGENAVRRYGGIPPYRETRNYVRKVRALLAPGTRASSSSNQAAFFVPSSRLRRPAAKTGSAPRTPPKRIEPARPPIYYRWRDAAGATHVALEPPAEGTVYTTIRALD